LVPTRNKGKATSAKITSGALATKKSNEMSITICAASKRVVSPTAGIREKEIKKKKSSRALEKLGLQTMTRSLEKRVQLVRGKKGV